MVDFSFNKRETAVLAVILLVAFIVRLLLFSTDGCVGDMDAYVYWFNTAAEHGIRPFYEAAGWCDYPPFNVYIFWAFGSLAHAVSAWGIHSYSVVKLAPTVFDLATVALIFVFLRKYLTSKQSVLGTVFYAFNPAIILNVAVWGQFDALYTFFLVLSLMLALRSKPPFSAVAFALAILTKPQAIALAPLLIYLIYRKNGLKNLLYSVIAFIATIFIVILPLQWNNPFDFLKGVYFGALSGYQYNSVNAFNFWGLFGMWLPDGVFFYVGWVIFGVFAALSLYVLNKKTGMLDKWDFIAIYVAFMLFFAFFMWPTRIHERYLYPAIAMLALMFPLLKKTRVLYAALTATFFVNLAYVLYWLNYSAYNNTGNPNLSGDPVVLVVGIANLVIFAYATLLLIFELRTKNGSYLLPSSSFKAEESETKKTLNSADRNR